MSDQKEQFKIYNSLSRKKETFEALTPPYVGLYVCGPTVYGDPHLGHARAAITFDILWRYLSHLGYKVRYVRNITDVGHLENDADEGEDKIAKKARLQSLEPMEIVQQYTIAYHDALNALNVKRPSIEPSASGHIPEQIDMIQKILDNGFAYVVNGSVYFDVLKYQKAKGNYGQLSGKVLEDLINNSRDNLAGQDEKRNNVDFALWKKAAPEHIMRWDSPWSIGFPGWHLECSVMSEKYLGVPFDIHGGGLDLQFPHHECEIAQCGAASNESPAKYWMHNNLITIENQKMSKSLGNFITVEDLFSGEHTKLERAYAPMTLRFFILQAHYRSTLDFSNEALVAAEKGLQKLTQVYHEIKELKPTKEGVDNVDLEKWIQEAYNCLNDDLNTAKLIGHLFGITKIYRKGLKEEDLKQLQTYFKYFYEAILGLKDLNANTSEEKDDELLEQSMELLIKLRQNARKSKDFSTADFIRNELNAIGVQLKDNPDGTTWEKN